MGSFKPGAAALCISRDVPCLPVGHRRRRRGDAVRARTGPNRGRPPVYVTFGEPMRAEDGETAAAVLRAGSPKRSAAWSTTRRLSRDDQRPRRPPMTAADARREDRRSGRDARRQAHEVVGLGRRGRRLPPRGQAGLRAVRARGGRPRRAHAEPVGRSTFERPDVPEPKIGDELLARAARRRRRRERGRTDDLDRIVHTYGKSLRDLVRLRAGDIPRVPDVVRLPGRRGRGAGDRRPRGRGGRGADPVRRRQQHLRQPASRRRRDPPGDLGRPRPAEQGARHRRGVRAWPGSRPARSARTSRSSSTQRGWTLGHFPDSFTHSTLGGWVATRSSGMQSDKYGDIADITRGLRVVHAGQRAGARGRCPAPRPARASAR